MNNVETHRLLNGRNRALATSIGLSPLWFALFFYAAPFSRAMFRSTGLGSAQSALIAIWGLAGILTVASALFVWRARSLLSVAGAVLLVTLPALILVLLGPAFALILANASR